MNLAAWERTRPLANTASSNDGFYWPIVAGNDLYFLHYDKSDNGYYAIIKMDRTNGYETGSSPIWTISSELGFKYKSRSNIGFNVNYKNGDIFFYIYERDAFYRLYKMKGYDDGTFDIGQISEKSYLANFVHYTNGNYRLEFLHFKDEEDIYRLYYRDYDANGNYIKND